MPNKTDTLTDLAVRALEASRPALMALKIDILPQLDAVESDLAKELCGFIETGDIFDRHIVNLLDDVLDDLAQRLVDGAAATAPGEDEEAPLASGSRHEPAAPFDGFVRANLVLLDLHLLLQEVHDRVQAERAVARLRGAGKALPRPEQAGA